MLEADALSPEKREQILGGASTVFSRDGYEGASMSRIAAEAGVSKGTLYNYFESKADLFEAWVLDMCARRLETVFGDAVPADPASGLREIGGRMLRMIVSPSGLVLYRVAVAEAEKFPEVSRIFYDAGPAQAVARMEAWIAEQVAAGRLRVPDPLFAAEQFFSLIQSQIVMRRLLHLGIELDEDRIQRTVTAAAEMFLNTYGVRDDRPGEPADPG